MVIMKRIFAIFFALMLLASCGKNGEDNKPELTLEQQLIGQWHSVSNALEADLYIDFQEDKTFELYQQIGEGAHRLYRGTWNLEGTLLTGKYNDGEDWAAAYQVEMREKQLVLTSNNDAAEKSTYEKAEIPAEVKETCEVIVKSK
jgi:uncharacterized protein (TIGR03066 family)